MITGAGRGALLLPSCSSLVYTVDMDSPIPLIDFSTPQTLEQLAEQVLLALTSVGFLHVAGLPGLNKEAIANAFSIVSLRTRCSWA